jgi:choline dehydrogenase-like flavoprotein
MPTIHLMGGTIMGTGAANSVVDSYGQTHEIPNLYVAGPGIFPTGGASNPTYRSSPCRCAAPSASPANGAR